MHDTALRFHLTFLGITLLLISLFLGNPAQLFAQQSEDSLRIFFSSNVKGETEPCG